MLRGLMTFIMIVHTIVHTRILRACTCVALSLLAVTTMAHAETVIDLWTTTKLPPPPALKPVSIAPAETAVLAMDFTTQTCTPQRRQRCADQVPKVAKLIAEARRNGALIIYSVALPGS